MSRPKILLTNDDSHSSELLEFIIAYLREVADLTIVVPKVQQSWKGRSFTVFNPIHANPISLFGEPAYEVNGTPADCVNIGIHHLMTEKPDLIVSGINVGLNTGSCFIAISGTVGACLEGNICGIPGIALSQHLEPGFWSYYKANECFPEDYLNRLRPKVKTMLDLVLPGAIQALLANKEPITWNINLPTSLNDSSDISFCLPAKTFYSSCFKRIGEATFQHEVMLESVSGTEAPGRDIAELLSGKITVVLLEPHAIGMISPEQQEKAQRDFLFYQSK